MQARIALQNEPAEAVNFKGAVAVFDVILAIFSTLLLLVAFTGIHISRPSHGLAIALCWIFSWIGQAFAPQLAVASLVVAVLPAALSEWTAWSTVASVFGLLSALLFVAIHWLGLQTAAIIDPIVNRALSRLGEQQPGGEEVSALTGLRPLNFGRNNVLRTKNIPYGDGGQFHLLDVYQPLAPPPNPMPVLIQIPGGAWVMGSKNEQALPLIHHMVAKGWTCIAANYRLGPQARFPAMLEDVLRVIAWVKTHAHEYNIDPDFIALTGGSAGGHLVSLAGLVQERKKLQPGFEDVDTRPAVVVPFYGRYDLLNRHQHLPGDGGMDFLSTKVMPGPPESHAEGWELGSPLSQIHTDAPPFFILHGSGDSLISVEEARHFARDLQAVSNASVDYAELPRAQHAFDIVCSSWAIPAVNAVGRYLEAQYRHYLAVNKHTVEGK